MPSCTPCGAASIRITQITEGDQQKILALGCTCTTCILLVEAPTCHAAAEKAHATQQTTTPSSNAMSITRAIARRDIRASSHQECSRLCPQSHADRDPMCLRCVAARRRGVAITLSHRIHRTFSPPLLQCLSVSACFASSCGLRPWCILASTLPTSDKAPFVASLNANVFRAQEGPERNDCRSGRYKLVERAGVISASPAHFGTLRTAMFSTAVTLGALASLVVASPLVTPVEPAALFPRLSTSCGVSGQASCHNTTKQTNLCCFESPGVS